MYCDAKHLHTGASMFLIPEAGGRLAYSSATPLGHGRNVLVALLKGMAFVGISIMISAVWGRHLNAQGVSQAPLSGRTSGAVLRSMALKMVLPVYPQDALRKRKTGVAVADIHLSVEGAVTKVEVLEAPDPSIGNSVRDALSRWRFQPTDDSDGERAIEFSGKLVFYFEIRQGKGVVLFPAEAGYVGSWKRGSTERNK